VAARPRESGAEAYPVTLTGMGARRDPASREADVESHILDLVRRIDDVDAPEAVIVGHGYGIRPALGVAGRPPDHRPNRLPGRGHPQHGDPALKPVPDQTVGEPLSRSPEGPSWGPADSRFRPAAALREVGQLPIVLSRVELERPEIAVTVPEFLSAAGDCGATVQVIDVPRAHHGFETIDQTDRTRDAVTHGVRSVLGHLSWPRGPTAVRKPVLTGAIPYASATRPPGG
jgi:hypothetical protein